MDARIFSARTAAAAALALMLVTSPAPAQQRWSLEVLPGVVVPTGDLGPVGLETGFGIEGTVGYRLMPHLIGYAGWDWHQFGTDEATVPSGTDIDETGYAFGFHLTPGARFRSLSRRVAIAGPRAAADLRYVAFELGGYWTF